MTALANAALARIAAAVAPCPVGKGAIPEVLAKDVVDLAALVAAPTPTIAALAKGAAEAAKSKHGKCHQNADELRHLVEEAGAAILAARKAEPPADKK